MDACGPSPVASRPRRPSSAAASTPFTSPFDKVRKILVPSAGEFSSTRQEDQTANRESFVGLSASAASPSEARARGVG